MSAATLLHADLSHAAVATSLTELGQQPPTADVARGPGEGKALLPEMPGMPETAGAKMNQETRARLTEMLRDAILRRSTTGRPDLLRALRRLRDPALSPMFAQMAMSDDPVLAAEGVLGSAELEPARGLDLLLVRTMSQSASRERVIRLGIDGGLLGTVQLEDLSRWPTLEAELTLLAAGELVRVGGQPPRARLESLLEDPSGVIAVHAAVILATVSDGPVRDRCQRIIRERRGELVAIDQREGVIRLLNAAANHQLKGSAALAKDLYAAAQDDGLRTECLKTLAALTPRMSWTVERLLDRLRSAPTLAERERWARYILDGAVQHAGQADAKLIALLKADGDAGIARMGRALEEFSRGPGSPCESINEMARAGTFADALWALRAAKQQPWQQASAARLALLENPAIATDPRLMLLAEAAVSELCENGPGTLAPMLKLAIDTANGPRQRAILAGAIRGGRQEVIDLAALAIHAGPNANKVDPAALALARLLHAKHAEGEACTPELAAQLAKSALDQPELPMIQRVQSAWLALRVAGEDRVALTRLLNGISSLAGVPEPVR